MLTPVHEHLEFLGITKKLGCGSQGCVYATDHDTVVKVAHGTFALFEAAVAVELKKLYEKHSIVPRIYNWGTVDRPGVLNNTLVWIEREPLNDLQLSDEGEAQYSDDVGRLLGGATDVMPTRFPSFVPARDRRILTQQMLGYLWLKKQGIELQDHNNSQNWGLRANGKVVLRDLGHIYIHHPRPS